MQKKFIAYQAELEQKKADLQTQYDAAKVNSEKMREMTQKLVGDINTVESRLNEAKQKLNVAQQQEKLNAFNEKFSDSPLNNVDNLFDEIQKKVDAANAAAEIQTTISNPEADVEELAKKYEGTVDSAQQSVEDRLAKLKASLQQPSQDAPQQ